MALLDPADRVDAVGVAAGGVILQVGGEVQAVEVGAGRGLDADHQVVCSGSAGDEEAAVGGCVEDLIAGEQDVGGGDAAGRGQVQGAGAVGGDGVGGGGAGLHAGGVAQALRGAFYGDVAQAALPSAVIEKKVLRVWVRLPVRNSMPATL